MEYTSRSGTLASVQPEQHPKTEYEHGFYHPQLVQSNSSNKDYLQHSGKIQVNFGGFDEDDAELPSSSE